MHTWHRYDVFPLWPVRLKTGKLRFFGSVMRRKLPSGAFEYRDQTPDEVLDEISERAW